MCTFHDRLRAIRLERGLTQQQLADAIGVTKSTMAKYDRGALEPNLTNVCRIADALNVSLDYLVYGKKPIETVLRSLIDLIEDRVISNNNGQLKVDNPIYSKFFEQIFTAFSEFDNTDEEDDTAIYRYDEAVEKIIQNTMSEVEQTYYPIRHRMKEINEKNGKEPLDGYTGRRL